MMQGRNKIQSEIAEGHCDFAGGVGATIAIHPSTKMEANCGSTKTFFLLPQLLQI